MWLERLERQVLTAICFMIMGTAPVGLARQIRNSRRRPEFHDHGVLFVVCVDRFT